MCFMQRVSKGGGRAPSAGASPAFSMWDATDLRLITPAAARSPMRPPTCTSSHQQSCNGLRAGFYINMVFQEYFLYACFGSSRLQ